METNEKKLSSLVIQHEELYKKISSDFYKLTKAVEDTNQNHKHLAQGLIEVEKVLNKSTIKFEELYKDVHSHNEIVASQDSKISIIENNFKAFKLAVNIKIEDFKQNINKFESDNSKAINSIQKFEDKIGLMSTDLQSLKEKLSQYNKKVITNQKFIWGLCIVIGAYLLSDIAMLILS